MVACAVTGYTYDFDVNIGKGTLVSKFGLGYDVVITLCKTLFHQGYHLYFDNYYTSVKLLLELAINKIYSCGTLIVKRKGVPPNLKDIKEFKKRPRGSMRWK